MSSLYEYRDAEEFLKDYGLDPAAMDALAWSNIIGGSYNFSDERQFLDHFTDSQNQDDIYDFFENRIAHNNSMLQDDGIEFLLPDDDTSMEERLRAISLWCETFISALGQSTYLKDQTLATKVDGHLRDLIEISKVDTSFSRDYDNLEEAELDFMELYEFLKVSLLSLDLEFKTFIDGKK